MSRLADLHRAIRAALASQRIGQPVFVRFLMQGRDEKGTILPRLARAAAMVRDWLGQPLERIYTIGSEESGQVSLTLQCRGGSTALVSFARSDRQDAGVSALIVGSHGSMHHDAGSTWAWEDDPSSMAEGPDPALLAMLQQALGSGQTESLGQENAP